MLVPSRWLITRYAVRLALVIAVTCLLVPASLLAQAAVHGIVVDPLGAPVAAALVSGTDGEWRGEVRTDRAGRFTLALRRDAALVLVVSAPGFEEARLSIPASRLEDSVRVTLAVAALSERVTVTAARTDERVASTPASVLIVSSAALDDSPSLALDDTLRQVPGFTLFRRSSSLTANPTTQGVSLRGLGASGTSRALVLDDGVPLERSVWRVGVLGPSAGCAARPGGGRARRCF